MKLELFYGTFDLPDSDEEAFASAAGEGFWDSVLKPYLDLEPGSVVIDVGAHVGLYTVYWAWRSCFVHAFESHPSYVPYLHQNVYANGWRDKVCFWRFFCYSRATGMEEREDYRTRASNTWLPTKLPGMQTAIPLDQIAATVPRLDMLKVDAQGADLHVLLGAEQMITTHHPKILIEYEDTLAKLHGHTAVDYRRWIVDHNYEEHSINGGNALLTWRG